MNKEIVAGEILLELKGLRERLTVLEQQLEVFVAQEQQRVESLERKVCEAESVADAAVAELDDSSEVKAQVLESRRKAPTDGRLISDLRRAIGLNDRFRFRKDLFRGDEKLMNDTIDALDQMSSLNEAMSYVNKNFEWDEDNETMRYLMDMLRRRFPD
ncbi:MAG: hypothetical protein J5808_04660 [Paludibacteraceae bacterium]|nr:hypothetical protein [Paludibacteraceae bacterium]